MGSRKFKLFTSELPKPQCGSPQLSTGTRIPSSLMRPTNFRHTPATSTTSSLRPPSRKPPSTIPVIAKTKALNNNTLQKSAVTVSAPVDSSSINDDVGQIRRLLEQLMDLLKSSNESQETLLEENRRLKEEVTDLKKKLFAITSSTSHYTGSVSPESSEEVTETIKKSDSVYFSPIL